MAGVILSSLPPLSTLRPCRPQHTPAVHTAPCHPHHSPLSTAHRVLMGLSWCYVSLWSNSTILPTLAYFDSRTTSWAFHFPHRNHMRFPLFFPFFPLFSFSPHSLSEFIAKNQPWIDLYSDCHVLAISYLFDIIDLVNILNHLKKVLSVSQ